MLPLNLGLSIAVGFALLVGGIYGADALVTSPWAAMVFWGLILGSGLMTLVGRGLARHEWYW